MKLWRKITVQRWGDWQEVYQTAQRLNLNPSGVIHDHSFVAAGTAQQFTLFQLSVPPVELTVYHGIGQVLAELAEDRKHLGSLDRTGSILAEVV